jgi:hypothetical protein
MTSFFGRTDPMDEPRRERIDPTNPQLRVVVARALAREHHMPLAFCDHDEQVAFDRKAQELLYELGQAL